MTPVHRHQWEPAGRVAGIYGCRCGRMGYALPTGEIREYCAAVQPRDRIQTVCLSVSASFRLTATGIYELVTR